MKTNPRLPSFAVAAGILAAILSCTQLTLPEEPTEVAAATRLAGYPDIQATINASLDKALAVVDASAARHAERDSRYATLSRALQRERDGNRATERMLNPDRSDEVTDEEQREMDSLMADDPALAAAFAALADELEAEYAAIPTIEVKVQRHDAHDRPVGEPYRIRSADGMIDFGYQALTSQEFLLIMQSDEHQPQRGFAAGSNYECYGRILASLCRHSFWPDAVVRYFFDPVLSEAEQAWMRAAIARMATGTRMTFAEQGNTTAQRERLMYQHMRGASPYLKISKKVLTGRAGQATVGKVRYATLEMHSAGVKDENTFNHEMGHVFGLLHEHQREDRNTCIRVPDTRTGPDYDIIRHDNRYWFLWFSWTQPNATTYATPYDYHSVMHYRRNIGMVLRSSGRPWHVQRCNRAVWGAVNGNTYFTPWDIHTIRKLYGLNPNTRPRHTPRPTTLADFERDADGVYPVIDPAGKRTRYSLSALLRALRLGLNVRPIVPREDEGRC